MVQLYEVVGYYLMQPISTLLEQVETASPEVPHFWPPVFLINSHAAAIILLTVTMMESFVNWAQHIIEGDKRTGGTIDFVRKAYPESDFADKLAELYAVRHAIAHSHIWKREMKWDNQSGHFPPQLEFSAFQLQQGYGRKTSFFDWVDLKEGRTRGLGISVVPTRIGRDDVRIVLNTAVDFLLFLDHKVTEEVGGKQGMRVNIAKQLVVFREKVLPFVELVRQLQT